jgi:hypothetical protein
VTKAAPAKATSASATLIVLCVRTYLVVLEPAGRAVLSRIAGVLDRHDDEHQRHRAQG